MAFAELLAHPEVFEEVTLRSHVGFLALHGGLEPGTAEIARAAAARAGASCYAVVQPDDLKRHVPSHEADPSSSTQLTEFLDHVEVMVSLHGYFGRDELHRAVLLGGTDRQLAAALGRVLRAALPEYRIVDNLSSIPRRLRGVDRRNPVNRSTGGGVQVELPHPIRSLGPYGVEPRAAASRAQTRALIGALAGFAAEQAEAPRCR